MITQIGIISGQILDFLDSNDGVIIFGQLHSDLKQSRDWVLMSLGWLLNEGHVRIIEDPLTAAYRNNDREQAYASTPSMSDLIVKNDVVGTYSKRIKNMPEQIAIVANRILVLLDGCGNLLNLRSIESQLNERRELVLMALGWLIREGYVQGILSTYEMFIFRLRKKIATSKMNYTSDEEKVLTPA